ncbi:MAG: hypothetical protein IK990_18380 [Ruminiclostridium sp.]|nr:hypothetical protein [Ruminiclostridium sp.]
MIEKTYDEVKNNFEDIAALAYKGKEAVFISNEGKDDLVLVSREFLNEKIEDIVIEKMLESDEKREKMFPSKTYTIEEVDKMMEQRIRNAAVRGEA